MPVFQFFFNVVTLFACKTNIHGAGIKYRTQLDTQVGAIGLENLSMLREVSLAVTSSTPKMREIPSILEAITWDIRILISQKRLSSTNMV